MKKLLVAFFMLFTFLTLLMPVAAEADVEALAEDALVYEGISARLKGDVPGIRSLYKVDMKKVRALEEQGYTVHFGALMGIASYNGQTFASSEDLAVYYSASEEKFLVAEGNYFRNIARVCVYASNGASYATGKFVGQSGDTATFAYTTIFNESDTELYRCELHYAAFLGIVDANGNATVFYDRMEGEVFGETASLYEVASYFAKDTLYKDNKNICIALAIGAKYEYLDFAVSDIVLTDARIVVAASDASRKCVYMPSGSYMMITVDAAADGFYGVGLKFANNNAMTSGKNLSFWNSSLSGQYSIQNAMRVKQCVGDTLQTTDNEEIVFPKTTIDYQGAGGSGESAYAGYVYMKKGENKIRIAASNISLTVSALRFTMLEGNTNGQEGTFLVRAGQETAGFYGASTTSSTNVAQMTGGQYIDWSFTVSKAGIYRFSAVMAHFLQYDTNAFEIYLLTDNAKSGNEFVADKSGATLVGRYDKETPGFRTSMTVSTSDRTSLNFLSLATLSLPVGTHTIRLYQTGGGQQTHIGYTGLALLEESKTEYSDVVVAEGNIFPENGAVYAEDEKTVFIGNGSVSAGYTNYPYASVTVTADKAGMYALSAKYVARTNDNRAGHTDLFVRNITASDGAAGCIYGGEYKTEAGALTDFSVPASIKDGEYSETPLAYVYLAEGKNTLHFFNHSSGNVGLYGVRLSLVSETAEKSVFVMAKDYVEKSKGASQHSYIEPNKVLEFRAAYASTEGYYPFYADYTVEIPENGYYRLSAQVGTNTNDGNTKVSFYEVVKDGTAVTSSKLLGSYTLTQAQYHSNYRSTGEASFGTVYMTKGMHTVRYQVETISGIQTMLNFRFDKMKDFAYTIEAEGNILAENGATYAADGETVFVGNGSVSNGYTNYPYASVTVKADIAGVYALYAKYIARTNDRTAGNTDAFVRNISTPDGMAGCIYGGAYKTEAGALTDYSVSDAIKKGDYPDTPIAYIYLVAGENTLHIFTHSSGNIGLYGVRLCLSSKTSSEASVFVMAKDYVEKSKGATQHSYIEPNKVLEFRAAYASTEGYYPFYADYAVEIPENGYYRLSAQVGTNTNDGNTKVSFYEVVKDGTAVTSSKLLGSYTLTKAEYHANYRATCEVDFGYVYMTKGTHIVRYQVETISGIQTMLNFRFEKENPDDYYTIVCDGTEDTLLHDAVQYFQRKVVLAVGDTPSVTVYEGSLPRKYLRFTVDETLAEDFTVTRDGDSLTVTAVSNSILALAVFAIADTWISMEDETKGELTMSDTAFETLSKIDLGITSEIVFLSQNLKSGDYAEPNPYSIQNRSLLLKELIKANDPDLIAVQEVNKKWINILMRDYSDEYGFVFGVSRNGTSVEDASEDNDEFGGILYRLDRFTLISSGTFWLHSETPSYTPGKNESSNWPRICTYAELCDNVSGKTFICMSTHLDESSEKARVEEAEPLVAFIEEYKKNNPEAVVLIAGDFNAVRDSASYNAFTEVLSEVVPNVLSDESKIHYTYHNFGTAGGSSEIDFIFYSAETAKPITYRVVNDCYGDDPEHYVSDHYGIVAKFGV